jgi:MinD-like ATPase involved in chromosome partitioning or flagellar assembly
MTQPDGWNFRILPGAPDPDAAQQLKVDRLEAVIGELRRMFDYVFIDFGRALSRISLPFIRQSSRLVLITSPDVATVSLTRIALNFFDTQDVRRNRIYLLLNRAVGLEGLSRPELERVLGFPVRQLIPHMSGQFSMANNQHRPVSLKFPNDSVTYTLQEIATMLTQQLEQTSPLTEEPELVAR